MNKKFLFGMFAAASMLLATSCSNDDLIEQGSGDTATVSFTINTEGAVASRAISEGDSATVLKYQVLRVERGDYEVLYHPVGDLVTDENFNGSKTIQLQLGKGQEYAVGFWAESSEANKKGYYEISSSLEGMSLSINYDKILNNNENSDAFFGNANITVSGNETMNVTLKRPFAQINVGASDYEAFIGGNGNNDIVNSSVVIKNAATTLNLLNGEVSGDAEVTFDSNHGAIYLNEKNSSVYKPTQLLTVNETKYTWLSMCYVLPQDKEQSTTVSAEFAFEVTAGNNFTLQDGLQNIPIQRNYRTNIIGNLLTNNVDFKVEVDANFEKPDHNITNDANELKIAAANGGEITLSGNITLDEALKIEKDLVINLNGHNLIAKGGNYQIANTIAALISAQNGATVTINGNGEINGVQGNTYAIEARGKNSSVIINGGTYVGNTTAAYALNGGKVVINGGTFSQNGWSDNNYVLNLKDNTNSSLEVTGGTFKGFNPSNAIGDNGADFVKEGYFSNKISENPDVYMVTKAKTIATTSDALSAAIKNGGSIYIGVNNLKITESTVEDCVFYGYPVSVEGTTTFKNVTFNNATESLTGASTPSAVYVTGSNTNTKNVSFEGCTFEEAVWDGIQITNPYLESISFKNCVFVNKNKLTPSDLGVTLLNRRYIHLQPNQDVDTRVEITGCTFTNVSLDYCPGSAICIYGYKTENMTINNNVVKGDGANSLTTDMIWISNGYTYNLWTVEQIKAAFVAE